MTTLMNGITLSAILMQLPILILIIVFSFHAFSVLKIPQFKFIFWGWIVNFIYILLAGFKYFLKHLPNLANPTLLKIQSGVDSRLVEFSLDFVYIFLFFLATIKIFPFLQCFKSKAKLYSLFLSLYAYGIFRYYFIDDSDSTFIKIVSQIPLTIFYILVLYLLAVFFFKEIDKKHKGHIPYLSIGVFIYSIIQFLIIFEDSIPNVFVLGFSIALISKSLICYGLHRVFLAHAEKYKEEEVISNKLNQILGRTFHELTRPLINMEREISKLLNEDDKAITYNPKAKKIIKMIEIHHSKAYANFIAQKKLYDWRIHEGKLSEGQKPRYDDKFVSISLNTLIEISILTLKGLTGDNVEFTMEYSSNCNIYCNPNEIIQIMDNILKNAWDAFPEKVGKIHIKTTVENIGKDSLKNTASKKNVKVEMFDNGEGINKEIISKIFDERFTTREGPGRGFGLAIVKDLVSKCQGEISIDSPFSFPRFKTNLKGTKVILILPKKE